jgi:hypothetical protein
VLRSGIDDENAITDPVTGRTSAPIVVRSRDVNAGISIVMLGYIAALHAQAKLLGWNDETLAKCQGAAVRLTQAVFQDLGTDAQ